MIITYRIQKPAELVFNYLSDAKRFVSVHPVIKSADYLGKNKYLIFETLRLGFLPISFTYPAFIESNFESKQVVMKAMLKKFVSVEMHFNIVEVGGYSIITETLTFNTIMPLRCIMKRIIIKQHARLFKNIKNLNCKNSKS